MGMQRHSSLASGLLGQGHPVAGMVHSNVPLVSASLHFVCDVFMVRCCGSLAWSGWGWGHAVTSITTDLLQAKGSVNRGGGCKGTYLNGCAALVP